MDFGEPLLLLDFLVFQGVHLLVSELLLQSQVGHATVLIAIAKAGRPWDKRRFIIVAHFVDVVNFGKPSSNFDPVVVLIFLENFILGFLVVFIVYRISMVLDLLLFALLLLFLKESVGHLGLNSLYPCFVQSLLCFVLVVLADSLMEVLGKLLPLEARFGTVVFHFRQVGRLEILLGSLVILVHLQQVLVVAVHFLLHLSGIVQLLPEPLVVQLTPLLGHEQQVLILGI